MIYHCIRFSIKPDAPQEEVDAGLELMREAGGSTPTRLGVMGRDFGGEYEYGVVSVFEDLEGYAAMMNDPEHLEMDRAGLPLIDKFMSFDITDDPDPEMGEKIAAIHQRRFDETPDLTELVSNLDEYTGSAAPDKHEN